MSILAALLLACGVSGGRPASAIPDALMAPTTTALFKPTGATSELVDVSIWGGLKRQYRTTRYEASYGRFALLEGSAQALVSDPSDFGGDWCIELDGRCVNFDPVWDLVGGINGDQGSSPPGVSVEVGTSRRIQDGVESNDGAEYPTILFKINTCWLMNGEHSLRFRYKPSEVTRVWSNLATKWSPEVSFRVACAKTSQISSLDSGVWISPDPDRRSAGIYLVASVVRPKSLSISISSGRFEKKSSSLNHTLTDEIALLTTESKLTFLISDQENRSLRVGLTESCFGIFRKMVFKRLLWVESLCLGGTRARDSYEAS